MTCATLTQAQINQRMRPWGDAEIRRFTFRHALFRQRGLSDHAAEALGDRLALRDQDKDDGRICLECKHIKPQLRCAHNQAVLSDLLWRCHHFDFEKPTQ